MTLTTRYIALYSSVDPAVLYENSNMIWKAIYPKANQNSISEYKTDISGYFYFNIKEMYYPRGTKLDTEKQALSALKKLINKIDVNISTLNQNNETSFPILFGKNLYLSECYPVIHQDSGTIWYWVCNFSIKLNPGKLFDSDRKCILMGEYIHVAFVENQILRLDYCHIPVRKSGISEYIESKDGIYSWPVYRRMRMNNSSESIQQNFEIQDSNVLPIYYSETELIPASKRGKSHEISSYNSSEKSEKIELNQSFSPFLFNQISFKANEQGNPGNITYKSDITIYVVTDGHFGVKFFEKIDDKIISGIFNTVYENNYSSEPISNKYILAEAPISKYFPIRILPEYKKKILTEDKERKYNNYFKISTKFNVNIKYINDIFDFEQGADFFSRTTSKILISSFDSQLSVFKLLSELWKFYATDKKAENFSTLWNRTYNELVYFLTYSIFENILKKNTELYHDIDLVVGEINYNYLNNYTATPELLSKYRVTINKDTTGLIHFMDIEQEFKPYTPYYKLVSYYINSINFVPLETISFNNLANYNPASNLILINNDFWDNSNYKSKNIIKPEQFSSIIAKCLYAFYMNSSLTTIYSDNDLRSLFALDKITEEEIIQILNANWNITANIEKIDITASKPNA
jgi:hypothetical protein